MYTSQYRNKISLALLWFWSWTIYTDAAAWLVSFELLIFLIGCIDCYRWPVVVGMRVAPPYVHMLECLVPSLLSCLGWIRRWSLTGGGVSLGYKLWVSKTYAVHDVSVFTPTWGPRCKFSAVLLHHGF